MIGRSKNPSPAEMELPPCGFDNGSDEYYRTVLHQLHWPEASGLEAGGDSPVRPMRTLGLTSCSRGEGVSTIAARVAAAAAGRNEGGVLLVDGHLAFPAVHRIFDVDLGPGLSEALLDPALLPTYVQPSGLENLELLAAGGSERGSLKTCDAQTIGNVLESLEGEYKLIVVDMPPAGQQSTALRWGGLLDAVVLVIEAERVRREVAQRAKELLERAGASVRGAILNKHRDCVPKWLARSRIV